MMAVDNNNSFSELLKTNGIFEEIFYENLKEQMPSYADFFDVSDAPSPKITIKRRMWRYLGFLSDSCVDFFTNISEYCWNKW